MVKPTIPGDVYCALFLADFTACLAPNDWLVWAAISLSVGVIVAMADESVTGK